MIRGFVSATYAPILPSQDATPGETLTSAATDIEEKITAYPSVRDSHIAAERARLGQTLVAMSMPMPTRVDEPTDQELFEPDRPWVVLVWNDPINTISYVTFVLQKLFGMSEQKASKLTMQVHNEGKAVVSNGTREKAELDVFRLHEHGLWATMEQD
jgi:ATP-dependent Clp protease adaptor protein ClpS